MVLDSIRQVNSLTAVEWEAGVEWEGVSHGNTR